jgi:hypothetical protein
MHSGSLVDRGYQPYRALLARLQHMPCSKLQETVSRLCIRMFVSELLATLDQGEQLLLPDLLVCHNFAISRGHF